MLTTSSTLQRGISASYVGQEWGSVTATVFDVSGSQSLYLYFHSEWKMKDFETKVPDSGLSRTGRNRVPHKGSFTHLSPVWMRKNAIVARLQASNTRWSGGQSLLFIGIWCIYQYHTYMYARTSSESQSLRPCYYDESGYQPLLSIFQFLEPPCKVFCEIDFHNSFWSHISHSVYASQQILD